MGGVPSTRMSMGALASHHALMVHMVAPMMVGMVGQGAMMVGMVW